MKNYNELISIIVPVYNTEKYLIKCIDSILGQTYKNLEILLVDDGSTDNSGRICDEYAKKDNRIKVIHKENGGQATARNMALDIAKGEYIGFVDSDDHIAPEMYETLYNTIKSGEYDISMCARYVVLGKEITPMFRLDEQKDMDSKEALKQFCLIRYLDSSATDKLIKKELVKDLRFPAGYICEDVEFVYKLLAKAKSIVHCGKPLYYYIQRQGSTAHSGFSEKTMGLYIYHKDAFDFILKKYPDLEPEAEYLLFSKLLALYHIMTKSRYDGEKLVSVEKNIRENVCNLLRNKYFTTFEKLTILLIASRMYGIVRYIYLVLKRLLAKKAGKKVAVVTIYGEENYGNRLQNYAVHKVIEKLGYKPETIVSRKPNQDIKPCIKKCITKLFPHLVKIYRPAWVRRKNIQLFTKSYVKTKYIKSANGGLNRELADKYNFFVVGSDQVWNPTFSGFEKIYDDMFLRFVPKEKRVCISPSLGISAIPKEWKERFTEGLNGFSELCVREKSGAELIKELTGKDAEVTIDPTLMLDRAEWLEITRKSKILKQVPSEYQLEYFLGKRTENRLDEIAEEHGIKRVTLLDKKDKNIYVSGISDFVKLIANAKLVCTDSFHACVFSIIFDKPFIIFKREDANEDMYSRITTLLEMFSADDSVQPIVIDDDIKKDVLNKKRKELFEFLRRNMRE